MFENSALFQEIRFLARRPTYGQKSEYLVCFDDQALRWSLLPEKEQKDFADTFFAHEYQFFKRCELCLDDITDKGHEQISGASFRLSGKVMLAPRLRFDKDIAIFEFVVSTNLDEQIDFEEGRMMPWHQIVAFCDLALACNDLFCEHMIVEITGHIQSSWALLDGDSEKEASETQLIAESIIIRGGVAAWRREVGFGEGS